MEPQHSNSETIPSQLDQIPEKDQIDSLISEGDNSNILQKKNSNEN